MIVTAKINNVVVADSIASQDEIRKNRSNIMNYAIGLLDSGIEQVDCPVKHMFANGVYIREILMPADTFIIGKIHSTEHFNEIVSGECKVYTPKSKTAVNHSGGDIFVSEAGVQKVVYNVTDVIWRTVHLNPTNTQDLAEIEKQVISLDYESLPYDQLIEECKRIGL